MPAPLSGPGRADLHLGQGRTLRPDTLMQTAQIRAQTPLANGAGHTLTAPFAVWLLMITEDAAHYHQLSGCALFHRHYAHNDITLPGIFGRMISVVIMICGVTLFLRLAQVLFRPTRVRFECASCGLMRHDHDAVHCKACGNLLHIKDEGAV